MGKDWQAAAQQVQDEERRRESKTGEDAPAGKPVRVRRAKEWSPQVEDCFRLQHSGWRDLCEYTAAFGEPDRWDESGFVKCTRVKGSGSRGPPQFAAACVTGRDLGGGHG